MKYQGFTATTSGEILFQHILKEIIEEQSITELNNIGLLKTGGRAEEFSEYFFGAYAFNLTARCIKKAGRIRQAVSDESQHQKILVRYFQQQLEIPNQPGERNLERLSTLTFNAADNSGKKISDATKRAVRNNKDTHQCYICGKQISRNAEDPESQIQYEHIWPSSYGGDSITGNLLPACPKCNNHKADMLLWQDSHIHSFILPPIPEETEWKNITRQEKIAKHRSYIFNNACTKKLTLKEAAIETGPISTHHNSLYAADEDDCVDFFNFEIRNHQ